VSYAFFVGNSLAFSSFSRPPAAESRAAVRAGWPVLADLEGAAGLARHRGSAAAVCVFLGASLLLNLHVAISALVRLSSHSLPASASSFACPLLFLDRLTGFEWQSVLLEQADCQLISAIFPARPDEGLS